MSILYFQKYLILFVKNRQICRRFLLPITKAYPQPLFCGCRYMQSYDKYHVFCIEFNFNKNEKFYNIPILNNDISYIRMFIIQLSEILNMLFV
jgi:hypothetical protein